MSQATTDKVFDMPTGKPLPSSRPAASSIFAQQDLIELHQSIEAALPGMESRVIQFASSRHGEGTTLISAGLAATAAALGRSVLFIDVFSAHSESVVLRKHPSASLIEVMGGHAPLANAIASPSTENTPFDYAYLAAGNAVNVILAHHDGIRQFFAKLKSQYQLICIHTSNLLNDPAGASLCALADGTVLVVEAERTRMPAVKQAMLLTSSKGARIIGMVFNKRRHHIPHWLYRRL